jgi:hypothetical protein
VDHEELERLQEYINIYFKHKKITPMPTQTFYVAEKVDADPVEYVSDINSSGLPVFSTNRDNAQWSADASVVEQFINRYNIENVKVTGQGGNHPPKPPING